MISTVTLLVAALVPDTWILVSDQRLTDARTGDLRTDRANKGIADLRSGTSYAYTGIAKVGSKPTDLWIMESLRKGNCGDDWLRSLTESGTRDFARLPAPRSIKRLAVIGVGWGRFGSAEEPAEPFIVRISNFERDNQWLPEAEDEFKRRWFRPLRQKGWDPSMSARTFGVWSAGQDISQDRLRRLERQLEDGLTRTRSIAVVARLVAEEVRSFASVNRAVGKGLLIVTVPKQEKDRPLYIESPMPPYKPKGIADHFTPDRFTRDSMGFVYVPPDLSAPSASYAPMILSENAQIMEAEAWADETPPWWKE
jgi:hypothetical protein